MTRNKKRKVAHKKVLIFVEGKSEEIYFQFLRQKLRLANVVIKPVVLSNAGINWVEKAKLMMKNNKKYRVDKDTDIYVVFDKDEFSNNELQKMEKSAKMANINIGLSNIMFEVWLLAHFQNLQSQYIPKNILLEKLSFHLDKKYKKADTDILEMIVDKYENAIHKARDVSKIDFQNQSTNLGEIIDKIKTS